jgi:hypothetical protein
VRIPRTGPELLGDDRTHERILRRTGLGGPSRCHDPGTVRQGLRPRPGVGWSAHPCTAASGCCPSDSRAALQPPVVRQSDRSWRRPWSGTQRQSRPAGPALLT